MAATANSVPWRSTRDQSGLPKPTEKRSTLTPQRLATQKWPNSWKVISRPSTTMTARMFWIRPKSLSSRNRVGLASVSAARQPGLGGAARPGIGVQHGLEVAHGLDRLGITHSRDQLGDGGEAEPSGQKGLHRHLVGRIEHRRRRD